MKTKAYLTILMVVVLVIGSIPVIAQSSYETEDVCIMAAILKMPTFTDGGRTPITELFEFPDFSVINTIVPAPITVFSYDGSYHTITVSHEEAWANALYEIDRIAWEFIANNPEFVAYVEMVSAEVDAVADIQPFLLYGPIAGLARDFNIQDGIDPRHLFTIMDRGHNIREHAGWHYSNNAARADALRHIWWSGEVAFDFGETVARIVTNNHEWAGAIASHFGISNHDSINLIRRQGLFHIASSHIGVYRQVLGFTDVFCNEFVKDFWNNSVGIIHRNRVVHDPFGTLRYAETTTGPGRVIIGEHNVQRAHTESVFSSRWPFHNSMRHHSLPLIRIGDVTLTGSITVGDKIHILQYLNGHDSMIHENPISRYAADVNRDGMINIADVILITQILSGHAPPPN